MGTRKDIDRYSTDQRYEVVLDNGEVSSRWSDLYGTVVNVASGTEHITGTQSISFDKAAGNTKAYMVRPLDKRHGLNLDAFSSEGQILSSVYMPALTDVASVDVGLSMSSGVENCIMYSVPDTDLSVGWNHLQFDCNEYTTHLGNGVDWTKVKYLVFGVEFDGASDVETDILVDSVRIQLPTSTFNFVPNIDNLNVASVSIGTDAADTARTTATDVLPVQQVDQTGKVPPAGEVNTNAPFVTVTDGTNDLTLDDADTARTTSTKVIPTQGVDATGKVAPAGETNSNSPFTKLTDGSDDLDLQRADVVSSAATIVVPVQPLDEDGEILKGGSGGAGGGAGVYSTAQSDCSVAYTAATQLTITGLPALLTNMNFIQVNQWQSGDVMVTWKPDSNAFDFNSSTGVLTVTGATFGASDEFDVIFWYVPKAFDPSGNQNIIHVTNPPWEQRSPGNTLVSVTDGTDGSGTTYEYQINTGSYKRLALQFVLDPGNGAAGCVVATIRASWKPGATTADCVDVTSLFGVSSIDDTDTDADSILLDLDGVLADATLVLVRVESASGDDSGDWTIYYGQGY